MQNPENFGLWILESWTLESGIPLVIGIQVPLTKNPGGCSYKTLLNAPPTSWHLIHSPGKISMIHIFCCLLNLRLYEDFLHLHPYRELKRKKERKNCSRNGSLQAPVVQTSIQRQVLGKEIASYSGYRYPPFEQLGSRHIVGGEWRVGG